MVFMMAWSGLRAGRFGGETRPQAVAAVTFGVEACSGGCLFDDGADGVAG